MPVQFLSRSLVVLFIAVSAATAVLACAGYRGAAQQSPENYFFFMQFYTKVSSPTAAQHYAPFTGCFHGHNIIFMDGCDGAAGFNKGVHFEPYKYALSYFYRIFQNPLALLILFILLFYVPLLYGARIIGAMPEHAALLSVVLAAYALYPGAPFTAFTALRPMIFFFPFFTLFVLSLLFRRSRWEQFLFLNLLLATREDALLLAAIGIVYQFFIEWRAGMSHKISLWMGVNWGAWLLVVAAYFWWVHDAFQFYIPASGKLTHTLNLLVSHWQLALVALAVGAGIVIYVCVQIYRRELWKLPFVGILLVAAVPAGLTAALLAIGWSAYPWTAYFAYGRIGTFVWMLTLLTLLLLAVEGPRSWYVRWWKYVLPVLLIVCLFFQFYGSSSALSQFFVYQTMVPDASLLFSAREQRSTDDGVLVDMQTSQLFYDFNNAIVYNGFGYTGTGIPVFHPDTPEELAAAFKSSLRYVIIQRDDFDPVNAIVHQGGKSLEPISLNASYGYYVVK